MPISNLSALAKKAQISPAAAEKKWKKAKEVVKSQYDTDEPRDADSAKKRGEYYKKVMGVFKKMIGVKKENIEVVLAALRETREEREH